MIINELFYIEDITVGVISAYTHFTRILCFLSETSNVQFSGYVLAGVGSSVIETGQSNVENNDSW